MERAREIEERAKTKVIMTPSLNDFIAAIETRHKGLEVHLFNNSDGVYFDPRLIPNSQSTGIQITLGSW